MSDTRQLTPQNRKLFPVPPYADLGEYMSSLVNFFPYMEKLLRTVKASHIVEIGCDLNQHSRALLDYCAAAHGVLHSVDPVSPPMNPPPELAEHYCFHRMYSEEFFSLTPPQTCEAIVIDGDHNFETLSRELDLIDAQSAQSGVFFILLHDVSWPWARRDLYYDISRIQRPHEALEGSFSPFSETPVEAGLPPAGYDAAIHEGGRDNGVLSAVESFLARTDGRWEFERYPFFYGVGVLCNKKRFSPQVFARFRDILNQLNFSKDIFTVMELNRIENLTRMGELRADIVRAGREWRDNQAVIAQQQQAIEQAGKEWRDNQTVIAQQQQAIEQAGKEWRDNQTEIAGLQKTLAEANRSLERAGFEWHENQFYISSLQQRLAVAEKHEHEHHKKMAFLLRQQAAREEKIRYLDWQLGKNSTSEFLRRARRLLPYSMQHRKTLNRIKAELASGRIKLLTLDLFDTVLLRDCGSEQKRFRQLAADLARLHPEGRPTDFYHARTQAHVEAYRLAPKGTDGSCEATFRDIWRLGASYMACGVDTQVFMDEELAYEQRHLRINPAALELIFTAGRHHVAVWAASDMYLGAAELERLLDHWRIAGYFQRICSSADWGVSKRRGGLYDRILRESGLAPECMLHIGDNFDADFAIPYFRFGINACWLPRPVWYCRAGSRADRREKERLHRAGVLNERI